MLHWQADVCLSQICLARKGVPRDCLGMFWHVLGKNHMIHYHFTTDSSLSRTVNKYFRKISLPLSDGCLCVSLLTQVKHLDILYTNNIFQNKMISQRDPSEDFSMEVCMKAPWQLATAAERESLPSALSNGIC